MEWHLIVTFDYNCNASRNYRGGERNVHFSIDLCGIGNGWFGLSKCSSHLPSHQSPTLSTYRAPQFDYCRMSNKRDANSPNLSEPHQSLESMQVRKLVFRNRNYTTTDTAIPRLSQTIVNHQKWTTTVNICKVLTVLQNIRTTSQIPNRQVALLSFAFKFNVLKSIRNKMDDRWPVWVNNEVD